MPIPQQPYPFSTLSLPVLSSYYTGLCSLLPHTVVPTLRHSNMLVAAWDPLEQATPKAHLEDGAFIHALRTRSLFEIREESDCLCRYGEEKAEGKRKRESGSESGRESGRESEGNGLGNALRSVRVLCVCLVLFCVCVECVVWVYNSTSYRYTPDDLLHAY